MTPQELKNSILQLAVQGKLVEQRLEEGTGEELFNQIQEEKQRLIKEGKIKKEKVLSHITDEEKQFEIPESWKWVRLNVFCQLDNGEKVTDVNLPYLEAAYLRGKKEAVKKNSGKLVQKGQYAILVDGENSGEVFQILEDGILGSTFKILKINSCMNNKYVITVLKLYKNLFKNNKKGAAIPHLDKNLFTNLVVSMPPLEEQKRIVAKIEEILPLIDEYEKVWNKLEKLNKDFPENMKKSILQYAIQGKLVEQRIEEGNAEELFKQIQEEKQQLIKEGKIKKEKALPEITDDEIPFDIPENWKWVRWGDLSESIQYGYNASAKEKGRIKMVRISDIQNNNVLWDTVPYCDINENEIETYLLKENDILFARTGGTVGKSFLVKSIKEDAIYAGYLIRTRYSKKLIPEYMKYFMETNLYWKQLRNGTIATAQPNCNGKTLSKMILPLPPLEEQKRIVEKIEQLLPLCEKLK